jgi:carbonic anhydrase
MKSTQGSCALVIFRGSALLMTAMVLALATGADMANAVAVPSVSDGFKKITSAPKPLPEVSKDEAAIIDENGTVVESSDQPILRPTVTVGPAPGIQSEGRGHAPASVSVPTAAPAPAGNKPVGEIDDSKPSAPVAEKAPETKSETKSDAHSEAAAEPTKPGVAPKAVVKSEPASYGTPAETSLKWLTNGNTRFTKKNFRKDGRDPADRARLLSGEKAHAIVLSATDSRVPPELIFDQALGEIITVRSAGPSLDISVIAAIELAVREQGPHLLVVLGNTNNAMLDLAVHAEDGKSSGSESLDKIVADIRPRLKSAESEKISKDLAIEATLNADGAARDLAARSSIIKAKIDSGELTIKSALYRLDTGKVTFY